MHEAWTRQTLRIGADPLLAGLGETGRGNEFEWSDRVDPTSCCCLWQTQFGLRRKSMPCQMTYCNVLARVDAKHLDELLAAFFVRWEAEQRCGAEPSRLHTPQGQADHAHLAIDGKTLRATTSQPHPVHQLSCYEVATGIVLWHCNVQEKENEDQCAQAVVDPAA